MTEFFGQEIQVVAVGAPVGVMLDWPGDTAPADWLLCQGQALKRSTYPALFAVLGTKYGAGIGDGTEFSLPDMRDKVAVGTSATKLLAGGGGAETVTHKHAAGAYQSPAHAHNMSNHAHAIPAHTHGVSVGATGSTYGTPAGSYAAAAAGAHTHTGGTDGGTGGWTGGPNVADSASSGPFPISGDSADATVSTVQPYVSLNKIIKVL
jgi:microcystin-dependent protein